MANFPRVGVEVVVESLAKFQADSAKVNKSFDGMGKSALNLGSIASSVTSQLTGLVTSLAKIGAIGAGVAVAGITTGLYKAASAGLTFNSQVEQASAKIGAFTKDADKTAAILEMVEDRAKATPFAFNEMADAAASLLPASIQSGEGLETLLEKAEILAASNPAEGLQGASFALKEALSGDFLSLVERFNLPKQFINDLKAQGVPNLEIVSQAMGQLGLDTDLVTAMANTAAGRWSTLQDTFTSLAGEVTKPIFDIFSQSLGNLNTWLATNEPLLTNMATLLATQVTGAITTVAAKATELFAAFQQGGAGGLLSALGLGQLVTLWATVQPVLSQLWTWLQTNIPVAIQTVSDLWNNTLMPGFTRIGETISTQLLPAFHNLMGAFSSGTGGTQGFADLWNNTLWPALQNVGAFVRDVLFPAWVQLEQFLVGALATAINLLADYWQNIFFPAISTVAGFVSETVIPALSNLWDWLEPKLGAAIQGLSALWTETLQPALVAVWGYTNDNIIPLLVSLGELINATLNVALKTLAGIWKNILLPAMVRVGDLLNDTLFPVFASIGKTVDEDVSPVLKNLGEVIFPILQDSLGYITEAIQDLIGYFDSLTEKVSSFTLPDILQGHSPPPMANFMMDIANATNQAALSMGELDTLMTGMTVHSSTFKKRFIDDLNIGGFLTDAGALGGGQRRNFRNIVHNAIRGNMGLLESGNTAGIFDLLNREAARFNFPPSLVREFTQMNGLVQHLTGTFNTMFSAMRLENLKGAAGVAGQFASAAGGLAEFLEPEMAARQDIIDRLQKFIDSGGQGLFKFDYAPHLTGVDHVMMARARAQQQLNTLLREQAEEQERINKLESDQRKLGFLTKQIEMLDLIRSRGLNPANILGGMRLGLEADAGDLVGVMSNIVSAMVNQINEDLQIASPSRVMMEVGQQMMAGLQKGIVSMTPVLSSQLSASVAGPISPMMAGALGAAGSTSNTYNFYTGQNTISGEMDMAIFEQRVLQVIRKNL